MVAVDAAAVVGALRRAVVLATAARLVVLEVRVRVTRLRGVFFATGAVSLVLEVRGMMSFSIPFSFRAKIDKLCTTRISELTSLLWYLWYILPNQYNCV